MDIFDNQPTVEQIDPAKDYFAELVGDDKKFKTPQDLARAKAESDAFIKQVLNEKRQLEEDLKTRTNMQDFLDQMKSATKKPNDEVPPPNPAINPPVVKSDEDYEKLIERKMAEREAENIRKRNLIDVQEKLRQVYGSDYANHVKAKAADLGIPIEWLNDAAAKSPKAFFELVGIRPQQEQLRSPPQGINTTGLGSTKTVKNWAYYNQMRKSDPTQYHSKQIQAEMWEQAKLLGPEFN